MSLDAIDRLPGAGQVSFLNLSFLQTQPRDLPSGGDPCSGAAAQTQPATVQGHGQVNAQAGGSTTFLSLFNSSGTAPAQAQGGTTATAGDAGVDASVDTLLEGLKPAISQFVTELQAVLGGGAGAAAPAEGGAAGAPPAAATDGTDLFSQLQPVIGDFVNSLLQAVTGGAPAEGSGAAPTGPGAAAAGPVSTFAPEATNSTACATAGGSTAGGDTELNGKIEPLVQDFISQILGAVDVKGPDAAEGLSSEGAGGEGATGQTADLLSQITDLVKGLIEQILPVISQAVSAVAQNANPVGLAANGLGQLASGALNQLARV